MRSKFKKRQVCQNSHKFQSELRSFFPIHWNILKLSTFSERFLFCLIEHIWLHFVKHCNIVTFSWQLHLDCTVSGHMVTSYSTGVCLECQQFMIYTSWPTTQEVFTVPLELQGPCTPTLAKKISSRFTCVKNS